VTSFEKLGAFYLGRPHDPASNSTSPSPLLYDSKDLTTHGLIVGMTGSGKTGLAIVLLEEAALENCVPRIPPSEIRHSRRAPGSRLASLSRFGRPVKRNGRPR